MKPKLPIKLDETDILMCILQWTGLKHGIQPDIKVSVTLRLIEGKFCAEVEEA